jgi:argininosuccinate lyase
VFDHARLLEASEDPELFATDLAERLVAGGQPFRTAHESVHALYASTSAPVDASAVRARLPALAAEPSTLLDPTVALEHRSSPGGPAPRAFALQHAAARARLTTRVASLSSLDRSVGLVEEILSEERT